MPETFVNDPLPAALRREAVALFASRRNLGLLALVAFLAGLSGPFGTYDAFSPLARHLYWLVMVAGTAAAGHLTGTAAEHLLARFGWSAVPRLAAAAALTAVPVFAIVVAVTLGFGSKPDGGDFVTLYLQCTAIVGGIAFLAFLADPAEEASEPPAATPKLLARLPGAKRGRLVRLAAQDHYVEVVTSAGRALIPMRLRDAIAEAAPEPGAQVHRSHWVALYAVSGRCRIKDRTGLRLVDGSTIPVGRTFKAATRTIGIS